HLTLAQAVPLTGSVIVSTPQDVGLRISMKTLRMFQQTRVPILGIIENMSYYICPHCNSRDYIFGQGGAAAQQSNSEYRFSVKCRLTWQSERNPISEGRSSSRNLIRQAPARCEQLQRKSPRKSASGITRRPCSRWSDGKSWCHAGNDTEEN